MHVHGPGSDHDHAHEPGMAAERPLKRALGITLAFMIVELGAGYYANSLALVSDGFHMLTDVGALLLSLVALWLSQRPSTPVMSYGYRRVEILGALLSGLLIWLIAGVLVYEAILRLGSPPEVNAPVVLGVATAGLVANLLSLHMLHGARGENFNVRAAYLHVIADSLGSVGAIIAGAVLLWTGWRPIDPIITLAFSGLMLFSSWRLIKDSVAILMEMTPAGIDPLSIKRELEAILGVREVHDLHVWTVASGRLALSAHLVSPEPERVLSEANAILQTRHGIVHTTIQIEHPERFASERCYDCAH